MMMIIIKKLLVISAVFIYASSAGCSEPPRVILDSREFQAAGENPKNSNESNGEEISESQSKSFEEIREFYEVPALSEIIDLDLTAMSDIMAYSAVNNMMSDPESYMGKTVKATGTYNVWYFDVTGMTYHFIVIAGPPGCCSRGVEFILRGDYIYPDGYPAQNAKFEAVGVFASYEELGGIYQYIAVDQITILE